MSEETGTQTETTGAVSVAATRSNPGRTKMAVLVLLMIRFLDKAKIKDPQIEIARTAATEAGGDQLRTIEARLVSAARELKALDFNDEKNHGKAQELLKELARLKAKKAELSS